MSDHAVFFDGVYATEPLEPISGTFFEHYLRFYADGLVLCTSANQPPEVVLHWFGADDPYALRGSYELMGDEIRFTVSGGSGTKIAFDGIADGNALVLRSLNRATLVSAVERYRFHRLPSDQS